MKLHTLATVALFSLAAPVWATTPASGELTEASGPQTFTGGPYLMPTPAGITADAREVGCTIPQSCDEYALTVNISDKFRTDAKNAKEVVQIIMTHSHPEPTTVGATADVDLYLVDSAGVDVASSTGSTATEAITVPLKTLKNGSYTVLLITGLPLGVSESVEIRVGRGKAATKQLVIAPMVAAPGEVVAYDASSLDGSAFSFGDGESTTSADGTAEHVYAQPGTYQARVSNADGKSLAMQPVVVSETASGVAAVTDKSSSNFGGAFGLPALFALLGLALLRRRV
ncbi:MAG: PKD domain-containing protein [Pseudomonadota bacterium]